MAQEIWVLQATLEPQEREQATEEPTQVTWGPPQERLVDCLTRQMLVHTM